MCKPIPVAPRDGAGLVVVALISLIEALLPWSATAQTAAVVFAGFEHEPLGTATLAIDATASTLLVDGLGPNGGGYVFQLDAEGGSIRFGDGITGSRPPSGSWNVQAQYRHGGGTSGAIVGVANTFDLSLVFDHAPVGTNFLRGTLSQQGQVVVQGEFAVYVELRVEEWPDEVTLAIEDGEMVTRVRWDVPVPVVLPDQTSVPCDEAVFWSQSGGSLTGEELGSMSWRGYGLDQVEVLAERFLSGGDWFEISGNLLLERSPAGHELTHVVQQGAPGRHDVFPPGPCSELTPPDKPLSKGIAIAELFAQAGAEHGSQLELYQWMQLQQQGISRIPVHTQEWTDHSTGDPGATLIGGFAGLGATSYTLQVFDDGLLVDSQAGMSATVARTSEFALQHSQTDWDFLHQRASTRLDLGNEVDITILSTPPRTVKGDRVHIIPEQLQVFPGCFEALGMEITKVSGLTLVPGIVNRPLPPVRTFGLTHQVFGDAILGLQNGALVVANDAWGAGANGPLAGGVRTPFDGARGLRWQLAGNLDPAVLPPTSQRSLRLTVIDANGNDGTTGLDLHVQNGSYAIAADFIALGSTHADVLAYLGSQLVHTGILTQQGRVLVDSDFNEVEVLEGLQGNVTFSLEWDLPQALWIDGQQVLANRISMRSPHRDRAVSLGDFESLAKDTPATRVDRASVRPLETWLSAVGEVDFQNLTARPLLLAHLDPTMPTGVEVASEEDPQGSHYLQLTIEDPGLHNALDGDERLTLVVQEEEDEQLQAGSSTVTKRRLASAPGLVVLERQSAQWQVAVDFVAAGYTGFRVLGQGLGELFTSSTPLGTALTCDTWPTSWIVRGAGDELWIHLGFGTNAAVTIPGSVPEPTTAVTLVMEGAGRPAFAAGHGRFLFEGVAMTALTAGEIVVGVTDEDGTGDRTPPPSRPVLLHPAIPNPFNPRTLLRFELAEASDVLLTIYDVAGRRVRTLAEGRRAAGSSAEVWDGRNERGQDVGSGVYFVELRTLAGRAQEKIVLVR